MKIYWLLALAVGASTAFAGGDNLAKLTPPTENSGISAEVLGQNSLVEQIPAFKGYDIRGRKITFAPGATLMSHSHAERPGFVYVLSGDVVESRNGTARKYSAGDVWIEDAATEHWMRNIYDEPAVIIMVDTPIQE